MSRVSPSDALAQWFTYLRAFQSACSFNTNVPTMDLLTFANSAITVVLPTANEQNQFIVTVSTSPGFDLSQADLTSSATFEALLDKFNPLVTYVGAYLQTLAAAPFPGGALADFYKATTAAAFPGGSTGALWQTALGCLASVIPGVCFTSGLQAAVAKTIDGSQETMSDVIKQIAVLG
jgi:hypothetical protein